MGDLFQDTQILNGKQVVNHDQLFQYIADMDKINDLSPKDTKIVVIKQVYYLPLHKMIGLFSKNILTHKNGVCRGRIISENWKI